LLTSHRRPSPSSRFCKPVRRIVNCYGEQLSATRPTPKLENHPFLAVRDCLFSTFAPTHRSPRKCPTRVPSLTNIVQSTEWARSHRTPTNAVAHQALMIISVSTSMGNVQCKRQPLHMFQSALPFSHSAACL
jgi:hypothetical protein